MAAKKNPLLGYRIAGIVYVAVIMGVCRFYRVHGAFKPLDIPKAMWTVILNMITHLILSVTHINIKGPIRHVIGGMAMAAATAWAALKVYRNYLSKAARACSGRPDKKECMEKFKNAANKARIAKLKSGMTGCAKDKNPEKCRALIQAKIDKLGG